MEFSKTIESVVQDQDQYLNLNEAQRKINLIQDAINDTTFRDDCIDLRINKMDSLTML